MKRSIFFVILFTCLISLVLIYSDYAQAIPAFARQTGMSCFQCHIGFPILNEVGMKYKQMGYLLPDEQGEYIWDQKAIPLAGEVLLEYVSTHGVDPVTGARLKKESKFELDSIDLFASGSLAPKISYFVEIASDEEEPFIPETAFLIINNLTSSNTANLKLGKFRNEFFYLSSERKLTRTDYLAPVSLEETGGELNGYWPFGLRYAIGVANDEREGDV